jgi:hypothetical protein
MGPETTGRGMHLFSALSVADGGMGNGLGTVGIVIRGQCGVRLARNLEEFGFVLFSLVLLDSLPD